MRGDHPFQSHHAGILRRLGLEGGNVPSVLEHFIDRQVCKDRRLVLFRCLEASQASF